MIRDKIWWEPRKPKYDPGIEAADPVMIVHEQMAYWRKRRFTYAMMCSAVTGWNVRYASPEATFDVLLMAWEGARC